MNQYLLLIHGNEKTRSTEEEWERFFETARASGLFVGGSEIGAREIFGDRQSVQTTDQIVGYMRFAAEEKRKITELLKWHPVVLHGGSVELCDLPKSG